VCRKVDFIITSLGSPGKLLRLRIKWELKFFVMLPTCLLPKKVESLGADALIAVNNLAGGHRGNLAPEALIKVKFEYNITCYLQGREY
jgi:nitronate monooxygenase